MEYRTIKYWIIVINIYRKLIHYQLYVYLNFKSERKQKLRSKLVREELSILCHDEKYHLASMSDSDLIDSFHKRKFSGFLLQFDWMQCVRPNKVPFLRHRYAPKWALICPLVSGKLEYPWDSNLFIFDIFKRTG